MTGDRIVVVALVNRAGAVLLRMRDDASTVRANRWSLPGGGVSADETPQQGATRIVQEQTTLVIDPMRLIPIWQGTMIELEAQAYLFAIATDATNKNIPIDRVPGAIPRYRDYVTEFVPGHEVLNGRSFTPVSGYVLGSFLSSQAYRDLSAAPDPGRNA